ncbi:MAG: ribosome biogenesis GTPase Der, partial [Dehalococcoidales bacterium]|nr:ribosome biogenesis GTPase Der [Dehalococcoidales bacterium]
PTFVFFVNDARLIHFSYRRYLENKLRQAFGFTGTPVRLVFKAKAES